MKIGVFDSGVGGLSVANFIQRALPEHEVILREDKAHVPYGTRTPQEIFGFVVPIFQELAEAGCQVIVVACNTVSTNLIEQLRARFDIPLIATEPMIKPAAERTVTGIIAVCATPLTLQSQRYHWLKQTYAKDCTVLEPDCSDWALMIQNNQVDISKLETRLSEVLDAGADIIVLGCTHYHWIDEILQDIARNRAVIIEPEASIMRQLKRVLAQRA
ncbi:MAG TPA: glutamate racemase [Candidatus Saccharimonadales bacterium]|nr:glutamate racemase [Candidatus Saccharimonadales bacterium]